MAATKTQKEVQVIARIEIKKNGIVVYQVRSSNGTDIYQVTVVRDHVNNCTCPARKPCYHMVQLQEREDERKTALVEAEREPRGTLNGNAGFSLLK